jgi:hypothetical protein
MIFDLSTQRFLIAAIKTQIKSWREQAESDDICEDDKADIQNDIGYAFTVLSEMEGAFFQAFGYHPE